MKPMSPQEGPKRERRLPPSPQLPTQGSMGRTWPLAGQVPGSSAL